MAERENAVWVVETWLRQQRCWCPMGTYVGRPNAWARARDLRDLYPGERFRVVRYVREERRAAAMSDRMCTCSVHCPESPYHERACCEQITCKCWCHQTQPRAPRIPSSMPAEGRSEAELQLLQREGRSDE